MKLQMINHVVNPVVRSAIRHRPHGRLAGSVGLITYQGRVTGREYTVPVECAPAGAGHYVVVPNEPAHKTWWRNFRQPTAVQLLIAGRQLRGRAVLLSGAAERKAALDLYFQRFPAAARTHHVGREADGSLEQHRVGELTDELAVICVEVEPG